MVRAQPQNEGKGKEKGNGVTLCHVTPGVANLNSHLAVLSRLLGSDLQAWATGELGPQDPGAKGPLSSSSSDPAKGPAKGPTKGPAKGPAGPTLADGKRPMDPSHLDAGVDAQAQLHSLISQVRDVLPEYGEGFVAAALQSMQLGMYHALGRCVHMCVKHRVCECNPPQHPTTQAVKKLHRCCVCSIHVD